VTTGNERLRVLIAEDHPVYRQGLAQAVQQRLDLELVGEASNGLEALESIRRLEPDVAVLDMKMPALDGMEVMRVVAEEELASKVLFLSGYLHGEAVYHAIESGAGGYLSKDSSAEEICDAITAVAAGQTVLGTDTHDAIAREIRVRSPATASALSAREREILMLTAAGHSAPDIAAKLYLSPATVKTHLQRMYQKLGVGDRAAAVAEAMRRGLLD